MIFKIRWKYSSPLEKQKHFFNSLVFIKGDSLLKLDVLQPLIGVVASLTLNNKTMTLKVPTKKSYYKGEFDSKVFFNDFSSFPSTWLIAILRAQPLESWNCQKQNKKITHCKTTDFKVKWTYKKGRLYKIDIKDLNQRQISAQISSLSSKKLSSKIFEPTLKNLEKQDDPLFFQNL